MSIDSIANMNIFAFVYPFSRESLQQMLHQNQRVVDNPVYLCDLGASLSAAEPHELQAIMDETNVGN